MGKLSDAAARNAKAKEGGADNFLSDGQGLYLRVRVSGLKLWTFRYKIAGKTQWFELGAYNDKAAKGSMSLAEARARATECALKLRSGIDPKEEKREHDRALAEAKAQAAARLTVAQLLAKWKSTELEKGRKDKGAEVERSFTKDVLPSLGELRAEDVTRQHIATVLDAVAERGAPVVARNLLGDLRQMFGFAISRGLIENDPTSHLKRDSFGRKNERDRVLSEDEVRELARKVPLSGLSESSAIAVWLMLSTVCRIGELTSARWSDVDIERGTWTIPADNAKNGKEHTVFLSEFAKDQFRALRTSNDALADRRKRSPSQWVLPARNTVEKVRAEDRDEPVCPKSLNKQLADRQKPGKVEYSNRTNKRDALTLAGGRWTPHDLRRTGATMMGNLGVRPDVIEKCLNHVQQNKLERIYQRQELLAERAEASCLLGERLALLCRGDATNVVTLNPRAA